MPTHGFESLAEFSEPKHSLSRKSRGSVLNIIYSEVSADIVYEAIKCFIVRDIPIKCYGTARFRLQHTRDRLAEMIFQTSH